MKTPIGLIPTIEEWLLPKLPVILCGSKKISSTMADALAFTIAKVHGLLDFYIIEGDETVVIEREKFETFKKVLQEFEEEEGAWSDENDLWITKLLSTLLIKDSPTYVIVPKED